LRRRRRQPGRRALSSLERVIAASSGHDGSGTPEPSSAGRRHKMRSPVAGIVTLIVLFVIAVIAYSSLFTVQQTEQALVVRFGRPVDIVTDPGLHFKAPFTDSVIPIDKRILDLENPSQEVIASDQKRLV